MSSLVFAPLLAGPWLSALAAISLAMTVIALIQRARGAIFRAFGLLVLFGILLAPNELIQTTRPLADIALLVIDRSQSMTLGNRTALADQAAATLTATAAGIDLRTIEIQPAASGGTALFAAIDAALDNIPETQLAGIIAITDGEIMDAPGASRNLPAPLTILIPAKSEQTDRELRILQSPAFGMAGQTVTASFEILDHGLRDQGATTTVSITEDGIARAQTIPIGQPITLPIPIRHAGPTTVAITAPPLLGEVSPINNTAAFTLQGIHQHLNILLISGRPTLGERSWRLLLKSDPAIRLVHFTILRLPGEMIDADPQDLALVPFPVQQLFETDLGKFDLIVLDSFNPTGLLPPEYLAAIADYVQNGGALLAEVGPEFETPSSLAASALAPALPAQPTAGGDLIQQFTPTITSIGARHPVTAPFAGPPLPPWYRMEAATRLGGNTLMTGPGNAPLLILDTIRKGRVALLLSDQFWMWTRATPHAGPALPLLRRIMHWLLREPGLEAESLAIQINGDTLCVTRQTLGPADPGPIILTAPDTTIRKIPLTSSAPGRYTASIQLAQPGIYKAAQSNLTAYAATSLANTLEYRDLAATASILAPLAQRTIWLGKTRLPPLRVFLRPRHATTVTGTRSIPLMPPLPTTILALFLLGAAWWRESR